WNLVRESGNRQGVDALGRHWEGKKDGRRSSFERQFLQRCLAGTLVILLVLPSPARAEDLQAQTIEAFNRYVRLTEAQIDSGLARHEPFLWVDRLPQDRRDAAYRELRDGKAVIEKLETLDAGKKIEVPGGLIHHWIGTIFIPGATLAQ